MPSTDTLVPPAPTPAVAPRRNRRTVGTAAASVVLALLATGSAYAIRDSSSGAADAAYVEFPFSDAQAVSTSPLPATGAVGIALADAATSATIDRIESQTASTASPGTLSLLARLLLQRASVTGDSDTYARAITALDRALAAAPDDTSIRAQRASARITIHDFVGAAEDAALVLTAVPDQPGALGASFDAALETGDYSVAGLRLARLVQLGPNAPQVLFREARWAALHGDPSRAANLAARAGAAADAAGTVDTGRATYDLLSGKLALDEGRYSIAIGAYESALVAAPGWHAALAGLGRARAAAGDLVGAEEALAQAADSVPLPETLSALGDVRTALGDAAGADVAYGTIAVVAQLDAVQKRSNRAIVLSRADRGVDTAAAVRDARAEFRTRRDVYGYDALGWALLSDGRVGEAIRYSDGALDLGTLDPRLLAHAGLAHAAGGDVARARSLLTQAISLSPNVDPLLMARVRTALASLPTGQAS